MAKFCGNCGTQLDDTAKICGQCGTPLEGCSTNMPKLDEVDPEKQAKIKKIGTLVVSAVIAIVVLIIAISTITKFTGYNGLVRKVMNAYEDYDIDTLIALSSDVYFYGEGDYAERCFEESVGQDLDSLESSVGHSYKFSYEINEIYTVSERKADDILDTIELVFDDFDVSTIDKIKIADLTVTAKQGKKHTNMDIEIVMTKEDGSWKLLYIR